MAEAKPKTLREPMRRRYRILLWVVGVLLAVSALLGGALWFAGQGPFLEWVVQRAVSASEGRLSLDGVRGSLYTGVDVDHLAWTSDDGLVVELFGGELRWRPAALIDREIDVNWLRSRLLILRLPPGDDQPFQMPQDLKLPAKIKLGDVLINSLRIFAPPTASTATMGTTTAGAATAVSPAAGQRAQWVLQGVRFALRYDGERYQLSRLGLTSPWGTLESSGQIQAMRPFDLSSESRVVLRMDGWPESVPGRVDIDGSLYKLGIRGDFSAADAQGRFDVSIAPLAAEPFSPLQFDVKGLQLRRLLQGDGVPQAKINVTGNAQINLNAQAANPGAAPARAPRAGRDAARKASAGDSATTVTGQIALSNEEAGRIDQSKLPVTDLSGGFSFASGTLKFNDLQVKLGNAGTIEGGGSVRLNDPVAGNPVAGNPAAGNPAAGAPVAVKPGASPLEGVALSFKAKDLDAHAIHESAVATRLNGTIGLDKQGLMLDLQDNARLMSGNLGIRGLLNLEDKALTVRRAELRARDGVLRFDGRLGLEGDHAFELKGEASRFEPQRWIAARPSGKGTGKGSDKGADKGADKGTAVAQPTIDGVLNGRWQASGRIAPAPDVKLALDLRGSVYNGRPLSGTVRGEVLGRPLPERAVDADVPDPAAPQVTTGRPDARIARPDAAPADGGGSPASSAQSPGKEAPKAVDGKASSEAANVRAPRAPTGGSQRAAAALPIERLRNIAIDMVLGGTRLTAKGALGAPGDRLDLQLRSQDLRDLDPRLGGSLQFTGEAHDTIEQPRLLAQWRGDGVVFYQDATRNAAQEVLSATGLRGKVDLARWGDARMNAQLGADTLRVAGYRMEKLSLVTDGALGKHDYRLDVTGGGTRLQSTGDGAFDLGDQRHPWSWSGRIASLQANGQVRAALRRPAQLSVGPQLLVLENADAALAGGTLSVASIRFGEGRVVTRGEFADIAVDQMIAMLQRMQPEAIDKGLTQNLDLKARGRFDISGSDLDDLTGHARLEARSSRLQADSFADVEVMTGNLDGKVHLVLPSLAWARQLLGKDWRVDGRLNFDGTVAGRVREPRLVGTVSGKNLKLEQQVLGWRLADGSLDGRIDRDRMVLDGLKFQSGAGSLSLRGELALAESPGAKGGIGRGAFTLQADHVPLSIGPGQRVVLSGEMPIAIDGHALKLTGRMQADEGVIELKDIDSPSDPRDLVIVGATDPPVRDPPAREPDKTADASATTGAEPTIVASADVMIGLGNRLRVVGNGLRARLDGEIRVVGTLPAMPAAQGTVEIKDGRYDAYGQELEITRGRLIFNGPVDNPVLDIVAVRRFLPVEAGVAISGTANAPRVQLISTPEVPDADKLSWLVLGVPLEDAGSGSQALALQAAAASILGSGAHSQSLSSRFGIDVIGVRTAGGTGSPSALPSSFSRQGVAGIPGSGSGAAAQAASTSAQNVFTVGKRLSSRLFLSYEQGLRGVWNLLRIQYDISNRLSLRLSTGSESAADLLYFYSFD